ncbi:MAG: hypothetical protein ACK4VY_06240 [Brevundimonas sp.]
MSVLLSVVTDVFHLKWGVTIAPGIPHDGRRVRLRIGDEVEIRPPGRPAFQAKIWGIPMGGRVFWTSVTFDAEVTEDMIPVGSEIWIPDEAILPPDSDLAPTVR